VEIDLGSVIWDFIGTWVGMGILGWLRVLHLKVPEIKRIPSIPKSSSFLNFGLLASQSIQ
jgi:hypothetical protein